MRSRADSTVGQDRHTVGFAVLFCAVAIFGVACAGTSVGGVEAAQERVTAAEQSVDDAEAALEQAQ
jgi:tRNA/tmRNA/rRNA uracil-C5-methylase (TrmA/RlmC/RlmD family)